MAELKRMFRPEFLNRVDDVIVFHPLDRENMSGILDIQLQDVFARLAQKRIKLNVSPEASEFMIEKGFNPDFGARPIRRAIERYVEDALSDAILRGTIGEGSTIDVLLGDDELEFKVISVEPKPTPPDAEDGADGGAEDGSDDGGDGGEPKEPEEALSS